MFLVSRYGKTVTKRLKDTVLDFYTVEAICGAKENMLRWIDEIWIKPAAYSAEAWRWVARCEVIRRYFYCPDLSWWEIEAKVGRLKMQDRKMRDYLDQRATDTTGKWGTKFSG